jgi:Papain family cysteine protease
MKGWHKHGVCRARYWPYSPANGGEPGLPEKGDVWREDSANMVLGAYYRIDHKSIVEMQAAIHEIHAIYCAADAHKGWTGVKGAKSLEETVIGPAPDGERGGHAFAIVGYTGAGFIVQNSWGTGWGYKGFALLPYREWIENGTDAWALALGAPLAKVSSPVGQSRLSLQERASGKSGWPIFGGKPASGGPKGVAHWDDDAVDHHVVISGIDGVPTRHLQNTRDPQNCVAAVAETALAGKKGAPIAIVIHGGLNGRDDGLVRAGYMGPWFEANGIVPFFPVWQTDAGTSILHALLEMVQLDELVKHLASKSADERPRDAPIDSFVEELGRNSPGKAAWTEMKNKARGLSAEDGALRMLFENIKKISRNSDVHLIAHSAGAIAACHALDAMSEIGLNLGSVSLYAPACTVALAYEKFGAHSKSGYLAKGKLSIDYLSDGRERADACLEKLGITVYSKSLLYLVSRAFEEKHKTPILGLAKALEETPAKLAAQDIFKRKLLNDVLAWQALANEIGVTKMPWDQEKIAVTRLPQPAQPVLQDNCHGSFDNNLDCVNATLARIVKTPKPIIDLNYGGG